jgi:hypothetical protein
MLYQSIIIIIICLPLSDLLGVGATWFFRPYLSIASQLITHLVPIIYPSPYYQSIHLFLYLPLLLQPSTFILNALPVRDYHNISLGDLLSAFQLWVTSTYYLRLRLVHSRQTTHPSQHFHHCYMQSRFIRHLCGEQFLSMHNAVTKLQGHFKI